MLLATRRRQSAQCLQPAEMCVTKVWLVEPAAALLAQNAGHTLPVEVDPLILGAVQTDRQILKALGVDLPYFFLNRRLCVFELERRQRFLEIGPVIPSNVARLSDACNERGNGAFVIDEFR